MTYKSIIQILLILAIISTVCISIIKPKMHEPVMVLNSQFSVEHDDGVNIDEQNIAVLVQDTPVDGGNSVEVQNEGGINFVEPKVEDVSPLSFSNTKTTTQNTANIQNTGNIQNTKSQNVSNVGIKNNNTNVKTTPVKTVNNTVKPAQTKVNTQPVASNKPIKTIAEKPKIDLNKIVNNNQKIINTPSVPSSAPVRADSLPSVNTTVAATKPQPSQTLSQKQTTQTPPIRVATQTTSTPSKPVTVKAETKPVVLTAKEEEIAWNKWRSNLNNQIMKDSKLPTMPNGIIFKYKFTVDKYGKVSNVQTSSTTPGYTPYAIQFIAPVIRSYQGRAILNFPTGSNRTSTEVSGAWKISSNSKLSTPDDYHDIEKIKR